MWRRLFRNATLALAGLVVAVAVGLAANTISQDSIGLSAQPLRASDSLAPAEARRAEAPRDRRVRRRARRAARRSAAKRVPETPAVRTIPPPPPRAAPAPPPAKESGDDESGKGRD